MSVARCYLDAALGIVRRDFTILLTYRMQVVTQFFAPLFSLVIFYYIAKLVQVGSFVTAADYFGFVVVGLVIAQVLQSAMTGPALFRQELVAGTFERMLLSPFGAVAGIVSMLVFPLLNACVMATVTLLIAATVFGMQVQWPDALLALPVGIAGAIAFCAIALFFLSATVLFKQNAGTTWVTAAITVVSGVYFPVALLPGWISWAADVQPFTATVDLLRHLLVGTPLKESPALLAVQLAAFIAVLAPLGLLALSRAVEASRRRGTVIEY